MMPIPTPETAVTVLANLKVGDTVIVDNSRYGSEHPTVDRIYRVTATQIILRTLREGMEPMDRRYRRDTGYLVGSDAYSRESVRVPTPELLASAEKRKLVDRLSSLKWKDLHLDTLRAVNAAIKTPTASPTRPTEPEAGKLP